MGEGFTFKTGNLYMETPTGYQQVCALNNMVDVTNTLDEAFEEEKIQNKTYVSDYKISAVFKIHPRSLSKFRRALSGWKASGPMRWKQFAKCYKRGWVF